MFAAAACQEPEGEQQAAGHYGGYGQQLRFFTHLLWQGTQFSPQFLPLSAQVSPPFGWPGVRLSLLFLPQGLQFCLQLLPVSFPVWFALHGNECRYGKEAVAHLTRKLCCSGRAATGLGDFSRIGELMP